MFQPKIFGKYLLVGKIGTGGIGDVFKAKVFDKDGYGDVLAIKTVRPILQDESEIINLFTTEAELSLSLNHKNIIKVFEAGHVKDQHFIAMEYINGRDLGDIIRRAIELNLKLPHQIAILIVKEICDGMDYVHSKKDNSGRSMNIVHRDLSPSNVLISEKGDIKIIDFGVAKKEGEADLEEAGKFVGKVSYASPEQIACTKLDNRSDIFSIGIIFYETLAKRNPFTGKTEYETLTNVKEANYFPIEIVEQDIEPEIVAILKKALAKKRDDRYRRASEFSSDLAEYLKSKNINVEYKNILDFTNSIFVPGVDNILKNLQESVAAECQDPLTFYTTLKEKTERKESKRVFIQHLEIMTESEELAKESALFNEAAKRTIAVINKYGGEVNRLNKSEMVSIFSLGDNFRESSRIALATSFRVLNQIDIMNEGLTTKINTRITLDEGTITIDEDEQDLCNYTAKGMDISRIGTCLPKTPRASIGVGEKIQNALKDEFQFELIERYDFEGKHELFRTLDRRKKKRLRGTFLEYYTPFVGRRDFVLELLDRVAKIEETGGLLSIRGLSGIGKTRLIREFAKREIESGIKNIYVECENKSEKTAYYVLIGIINELFNIAKDDSDGLIKTKLQNLSLADKLVLGKLLGIEFPESGDFYLTGENLENEIVRVTREALINYSKNEHIIIFIDDFNFIDDKSKKFFSYFIPALNTTKVLFVLTHDKNLSIFQGEAPVDYSIMDIEPFNEEESLEFVRNLMPELFNRDEILKKILNGGRGIPLYLEESIKSLKAVLSERKISVNDIEDSFAIEDSLSGLFVEKIKRLDHESKMVLKLASILGKIFAHELCEKTVEIVKVELSLAASFDELIENLMREEILQIDFTMGEMSYKFKSDELVEIAKGDIAENLLPIFTRATGEAIEELYTDRIEDYYERLAGYYKISKSWAKALHFSELSGDKLSSRYINDQALTFYEGALAILDKGDELGLKTNLIDKKKIVIKHKIGNLYYITSRWDDGIKLLSDTVADSDKVFDKSLKAQSIHILGKFQKAMSKWDGALQYFEDALEIVGKLKEKQLMSEILREIAGIKYFTGKIEQSLIILKEGVRIAEEVNSPPLLARYQNDLGMVYAKQGLYERALNSFETSLSYKEKMNDKFGQGITLGNIVDIYYMQLDYKKALYFVLKSLEITKAINDTWGIAVNYHNLGNIYFQLNDNEQAIKAFWHSIKISKELKWDVGILINEIMLAYLENTEAITDTTINKLKEYEEILEKKKMKDYLAKVYYFTALLLKEIKKDAVKSEEYLNKAQNLANEIGATDVLERINRIQPAN